MPYSTAAFRKAIHDGRVVLVSYIAYWDGTTPYVEAVAVNTPAIGRRMRALGVIAMRADLTDGSAEIKKALRDIGEIGVPVIAIYFGPGKNDQIVFSDEIAELTEDKVLVALDQGVLSKQGY